MATANINIKLSDGKQAGQTIKELRQQANRLTREVNNLKPGTDEFVKKSADLKLVGGRLKEVRDEVKGVNNAAEAATNTIKSNVTSLMSNGKKAELTLNELSEAADHLKKEIAQLKPGSDEFVKASEELKVVNKRMEDVEESTKATSSEFMAFLPFGGYFDSINGQIITLSGGFKSLRVAMMAIPILAIVGAFTALYQWFSRTEEGAQKLRVITAALGQVMDSLLDVVSAGGKELFEMFSSPKEAVKSFGDSIKNFILGRIELLMKGVKGVGTALELLWDKKFKDAAKAAGEAFIDIQRGINPVAMAIEAGVEAGEKLKTTLGNVYDEVKKDTENAIALQERENRLLEQKRDFKKREVQLENEISELRLIGNNQELSSLERAAAMQEAMEKQQQLSRERVALAKEEYLIQKERNLLSDTSEADKDRAADLETEIIRIKKQSTDQQREIFSMLTGLRKQEHDKQVREAEAAAQRELEAAKELEDLKIEAMEDVVQKQIAKIQLDTERKIAALTGSEEQIREQRLLLEEIANQQIADAKEKHNQEELERQKAQKAKQLEIEKQHKDKLKEIEKAGLDFFLFTIDNKIDALSQDEESRKKNAERIKELQKSKIKVNLASEIQGIWAGYASFGPLAAILAGIQTAFAVARAGKALQEVDKQKFAKGGILRGNRHSNGGIPGVVRSTGQPIEMEDGEIILNRRVGMSAFGRAAASNLNAMFGGTKFEAVAPVNPFMEKGGFIGLDLFGVSAHSRINEIESSRRVNDFEWKTEILNEVKEIKSRIRNLKVVNNLQDTRQGLKTLNTFEDDVDL
jgi:hypothetical protein